MPDISMCRNKDCAKKEQCYRFRAIPTSYFDYETGNREEYQTYTHIEDHKKCHMFWRINIDGMRIRTMEEIEES